MGAVAKKREGAIQPFERNRIRYIIESMVDKQCNEALRDTIRDSICAALGITNRYSMMLNNTVQPSLKEATTIAQILEVSVDELYILSEVK